MHVAHVQGIFSVEHGGPTQSTLSYCRGQVARGDRVSLWVLEGYANTSPAVRLPLPVEMNVFPVAAPEKLGRSPAMKQSLLASAPADVYHMHGVWLRAGYYGALKARRSAKPFLIELAGAYEPYAIKQKPLRKLIARYWFQDRMIRQAGCIHLNSPKEAQFLREMGFRTPMIVLPVGVDTDAIERGASAVAAEQSPWPELASRPFFLFLSRLHRNKGIELLLEAWAKLAAKHPAWVLAVAGPASHEYADQCRQLAASAGIANRVVFVGKVTDAQRSWLYTHCGFYVLPSYSENFGNTVAEALAHGRPVIATTNTPWGLLPGEGCGWITEPDFFALTDTLEQVLSATDSDRTEMGERGRQLAGRQFSLRFVVDRLAETYSWLRGSADRPALVQS